MAANAQRIKPKPAHQDLVEQPDTLLVCAYDSEEKFQQNHLEGAMPLGHFKAREDSIDHDREVIFYCDCPNDELSDKLAKEYRQAGFQNAKSLEGGVEAWKKAGFGVIEPVR
jgi:rhodanese-related sulfurtransferase